MKIQHGRFLLFVAITLLFLIKLTPTKQYKSVYLEGVNVMCKDLCK